MSQLFFCCMNTGSGMDPAACPKPNPCSAEASAWHTRGSPNVSATSVLTHLRHMWSQKPLQHHFPMLKLIFSKEKVRKKKAGVLEITLCKFQDLKVLPKQPCQGPLVEMSVRRQRSNERTKCIPPSPFAICSVKPFSKGMLLCVGSGLE